MQQRGKGISPSKTSNKSAGETKDQSPLGCIHCFPNPKLRRSNLNHSFEERKLKPGSGNEYKQSSADRSQPTVNHAQLKAAIRDLLNEPPNKKRSRDLSVAIPTTVTWIATRNRERIDKDLQIAQSVRRTSMRNSTAELATYFPHNFMKIRPLISTIRLDLSYLAIKVVYLHMPLPNMEC